MRRVGLVAQRFQHRDRGVGLAIGNGIGSVARDVVPSKGRRRSLSLVLFRGMYSSLTARCQALPFWPKDLHAEQPRLVFQVDRKYGTSLPAMV